MKKKILARRARHDSHWDNTMPGVPTDVRLTWSRRPN